MKRYSSAIEEWEQLKKACSEKPLNAVRKNRIKASEDFEDRLRREFDDVEQSKWNSDVYRLKNVKTPGKTMMHWRGEYYVQEESAALPVNVLSPEKGEKVLDICAAPGGKTTQIASEMENNGLVVANDEDGSRLKSLHSNVYRTGSACVSVTNLDGRRFPGKKKFDRVLVDAPCTGEYDRVRRAFEKAEYEETDPDEAFSQAQAGRKEIEGLSNLQKQLLERASELLKAGGTLVYSTCTFAPEENEEVVKNALEETKLELEEFKTEISHKTGFTEFKEKKYGEELLKTVRVYPHHVQSGGIYVAKFRK